MNRLEVVFGVLRIPMDFMMVMASLSLAYVIRPYTDLIPWVQYPADVGQLPSPEYYFYFALICTGLMLFLYACSGLYNLKTTYHVLSEFGRIFIATTIWLMAVIAFFVLVIHELPFSRLILFHSWLFSIAYVFLGRMFIVILQTIFLKLGFGKRRLLFIGLDDTTDQLFARLRNDLHYEVVGTLAKQVESRKRGQVKIIGQVEDFAEIILRKGVDEVICIEKALKDIQLKEISSFCHTEHIEYLCVPDLKHTNFSLMELDLVSGIPVVSYQLTPLAGWHRVLKRFLDVIGALFALILLSPLLIVVALLVKLTSRGPVFYMSKRVGLMNRQVFPMVKFRSMVVNADELKKKLAAKSHRSGPLFKVKNDPRVTRLGRFLRRTSIDELPQLFNVVLGHMSLVGPRPHLPEEVAKYEKHHKVVLGVKPGITGLAQINGRSDLDFEEEVRLDRFYIEQWSLLLDLRILIKTIGVVLRGKGAD